MSMFKTIIVGAGPAGLTAGRYLKDALILDKKPEIGNPVQCGEGITKHSLEKENIKIDPFWVSAYIDTFQLTAPNGKTVSFEGEEDTGYVLDRTLFEKSLAKDCLAEIKLNSKVIDIKLEDGIYNVKTENGEIYKSEYIIAADGPLSIVRRKFFKEKPNFLPTINYLVELEKEIDMSVIRMYFDQEKYPLGYVWIFPKSKNTANIGLGGKAELDKKFNYFMKNVVEKEFGKCKILENRSGTISWGGSLLKLRNDNVLLTGDAAGLIDPIFGGGMVAAIISGRIAAEHILKDDVSSYEEDIKSKPFANKELFEAQDILYSLPNAVFNEFAETFEGKCVSDANFCTEIFKLLFKPALRRNIWKIFRFFYIIKKGGVSL